MLRYLHILLKIMKRSKGIKEVINQFVDDTMFSLYSQNSLQAIINTFIDFEHNMGLKTKYDKSTITNPKSS